MKCYSEKLVRGWRREEGKENNRKKRKGR